ncbi:MAG: IS200/IS605 family transposase [Myxococcales bacterium]|nr:IS200/IS605 family transposase [Myxococcales bacterium]
MGITVQAGLAQPRPAAKDPWSSAWSLCTSARNTQTRTLETWTSRGSYGNCAGSSPGLKSRATGREARCGLEEGELCDTKYLSLHVHLVWAVKERESLISVEVRAWMWPLLAQKARDLGSQFVVVGGVEDHVHVLPELPATVSVAELVRRLQGASSKIASDRGLSELSWQEGYAAFTVSRGARDGLATYIRNQENHHANKTLDTEAELP